jgi:transposase, IS30 family
MKSRLTHANHSVFWENKWAYDISPETVYQRVYADKRRGGLLWTNLRCQQQRKKRYGKTDRRGMLPNRQSIERRPVIVDTRRRISDWEADTIIGKNHQHVIVSLVERKTEFLLIRKVERKTAQAVGTAMTSLLKPYRKRVGAAVLPKEPGLHHHYTAGDRYGNGTIE